MVGDEEMGGDEGVAPAMSELRRWVTSGGEDAVVAAVAGVAGEDEGLGGAGRPSRADLRMWVAAGADIDVEDYDLEGDEEEDISGGTPDYGSLEGADLE